MALFDPIFVPVAVLQISLYCFLDFNQLYASFATNSELLYTTFPFPNKLLGSYSFFKASNECLQGCLNNFNNFILRSYVKKIYLQFRNSWPKARYDPHILLALEL